MNIASPHIQRILEAIKAAGGRPLIVGGAVRDWLMGGEGKDFDVEVYGLSIDRLSEVLAGFGRVDAVGRSFGILKMRLPDGQELDVSLPRRESKVGTGHRGFIAEPDPTMTPHEAAARRDFTWNALALTPEGELLDYFGGAADLNAGIIRHTGAAFAEDPLRVLRAMQFAARFDMHLAPETAALCRALLPEAPTLATERVWGEWRKWALKGRKPSAGLCALAETGWIALYPEIEALVGCPQDPTWHPEGWSIFELTGKANNISMTQSVDMNVPLPSRAFREFLTSAPSSLVPAAVTNSERLVWSFATTGISTDEAVRVMFQIPLRYVKSVMLTAIDDFEVVRRIVHPIAVYVKNMLPMFQGTTELQFHNNSVDGDSSVLARPGSVHVPIIIVDARTATIDGDVLFHFDLAIVRHDDVAYVPNHSTPLRVFQVEIGDVWTHTLHVVDAAATIADRDGLVGDERAILLFAALCHDLGKPAATGVGDDGRIRSPGHAQAGVEPTETLLRRIGCLRNIATPIVPLVREHMAHLRMAVTAHAVRRLAVRLAPATIAQWDRLVEADHSGRPPLPPEAPATPIAALAEQIGVADGRPQPLLQGRHLIAMGVTPGPRLGAILDRAYQAQIDGAFATVEEGLAWVARHSMD